MKKTYKLQDLDCANCAAKMETAIKNIPDVTNASVSFMTQKLSIEAPDNRLEQIMDEVEHVIKKIEPDAVLVRR